MLNVTILPDQRHTAQVDCLLEGTGFQQGMLGRMTVLWFQSSILVHTEKEKCCLYNVSTTLDILHRDEG